MTTLKQLREKSGLTPQHFADAMPIDRGTYKRFEAGKFKPHDGHIADAHQTLADIDWAEAFIAANPEMINIHHWIWQMLLDKQYDERYK